MCVLFIAQSSRATANLPPFPTAGPQMKRVNLLTFIVIAYYEESAAATF